MTDSSGVGADHCRVTPPGADQTDPLLLFEYCRHLFPYHEVADRLAPESRLLEVGFGGGYGAGFLSSRLGSVTATDISQEAIGYAASRYPAVDFRLASGTSLPFADESFDAAISFQVIEHIDDAATFLKELRRVLRQGGTLYLTTPNRKLRLLPFQKPWNSYHVREYSARSLKLQLRDCFPDAEICGVMATPGLMSLETERVRPRLKKMIRRHLAGLRGCVAGIMGAGAGTAGGASALSDLSGVGMTDFFLADETDRSLDLFCVAVKK